MNKDPQKYSDENMENSFDSDSVRDNDCDRNKNHKETGSETETMPMIES